MDGSDVIVSDGYKYEDSVEYFIENTAENEDKFSEDIIYKEDAERCLWFFNVGHRKEEDKKLPHLLKPPYSGKPYIRCGGLIARVWAFKKFEFAFGELLKGSEEWWSDQGISKPLLICIAVQKEAVGQRFALKRGMVGLDYEERFFTIPNSVVIRAAPFIYFLGKTTAWEEKAKLIMKSLDWYTNKLRLNIPAALSKELVQTFLTNGQTMNVKYSFICSTKEEISTLFRLHK